MLNHPYLNSRDTTTQLLFCIIIFNVPFFPYSQHESAAWAKAYSCIATLMRNTSAGMTVRPRARKALGSFQHPSPLDHVSWELPSPETQKTKNWKHSFWRHRRVGRLSMAQMDPSRQVSMMGSFKKIGIGPKGPLYPNRLKKTHKKHDFPYTACGFYIKIADFLHDRRVDPD